MELVDLFGYFFGGVELFFMEWSSPKHPLKLFGAGTETTVGLKRLEPTKSPLQI